MILIIHLVSIMSWKESKAGTQLVVCPLCRSLIRGESDFQSVILSFLPVCICIDVMVILMFTPLCIISVLFGAEFGAKFAVSCQSSSEGERERKRPPVEDLGERRVKNSDDGEELEDLKRKVKRANRLVEEYKETNMTLNERTEAAEKEQEKLREKYDSLQKEVSRLFSLLHE